MPLRTPPFPRTQVGVDRGDAVFGPLAHLQAMDLRMLRELFLDRVSRFGGIDPRITWAEVGRRLALPRSTVIERAKRWVDSGFFQGFILFPNPQPLGLAIYGQALKFDGVRARTAVTTQIAKLPTAVQVMEPEHTNWLWLGYLDTGPGGAIEGARTLAKIPGVEVELLHHVYPIPECTITPSHLDWRIIQGLRANPHRPLGEVASGLNVGFRTFLRHYNRLIDTQALLCFLDLDFARTSGTIAELNLSLQEGASVGELWSRVEREYDAVLPIHHWNRTDGVADVVPGDIRYGPIIQYLISVPSPAGGVRASQRALRWPGIGGNILNFPYRWWSLPDRYDAFVERAIRATT